DSRLDLLGGCDIGLAAVFVALPHPSQPASIERACKLWLDPKRKAVIFDRRVEPPHLQINEAARIVGRGIVPSRSQCPVTILQRRLQRAEHDPTPAASAPRGAEIGRKADGLVIILRGAI